jgi:hypothetical protein
MLPKIEHLRRVIEWNLADKERQGHDATAAPVGPARDVAAGL